MLTIQSPASTLSAQLSSFHPSKGARDTMMDITQTRQIMRLMFCWLREWMYSARVTAQNLKLYLNYNKMYARYFSKRQFEILNGVFPQTFVWRNDFVHQSIIFSLVLWKYHFFTPKFLEMPHLFPSEIFHLFYAITCILFVL